MKPRRRRRARSIFSGTEQTEQIRERIDRVLADAERLVQELRELRAAVAGDRPGDDGLTEAERAEIDALVAKRAARLRRAP